MRKLMLSLAAIAGLFAAAPGPAAAAPASHLPAGPVAQSFAQPPVQPVQYYGGGYGYGYRGHHGYYGHRHRYFHHGGYWHRHHAWGRWHHRHGW